MRFLHPEHDEKLELANDDVFLTPSYFDGSSRLDTDLTPPDFVGGSHPIVSANMNAVTGKRISPPIGDTLALLPKDVAMARIARAKG